MVDYIRSDLEAILFHIKIAEANAAGQPLYGPGGLIPTYNLSWGLRTADGSYNNLLPGREYWGAANTPFPSYVDPTYRTFQVDLGPGRGGVQTMNYTPTLTDPDGPGRAVAGDVYDPALRTISNLIVDQTLGNPAAIMEAMRRNGIEGDLLDIAIDIVAANKALPALQKTAAAKQVLETAALAVLATETSEQAAAAAAAAITASALAAANAAVTQDVSDLAAATAASNAADAAVIAAQGANAAAQAALVVAQADYDAALAAAGSNAAALAAATTALANATSAYNAAASALTAAVATAADMAALEDAAADALLATLGVQAAALDAYADAQADLDAANDAVTAAEEALAAATLASDEADAASDLAQSHAAAAQAALDAAQGAFDAAELANDGTAATLAVATSDLATANTAHDLAVDAANAAAETVSDAQAAEAAAATDLATAEGLQTAAQAASDAADLTLAAYDAALARDVELRASDASDATGAMLTSLGSGIDPLDADDYVAVTAAIDAASAASAAAAAAYADLQVPGVAPADLAAAAAAADKAALLVDQLTALQTALLVDNILDAGESSAAQEALDTAGAFIGLANDSTVGMAAVGRPAAQANADAASTDLAAANAAVTAAEGALSTATADSNAADAALVLAQGNEAVAQDALDTAQAAFNAAENANDATAATLASATTALATATSANTSAANAAAVALAAAVAAQDVEDDASDDLATAQGLQSTAQQALLAAGTALTGANTDVTEAQGALTTATAKSDAADEALALAQDDEAAAQSVLDGAQSAYDSAVAASGPAGAALTAATAALADANEAYVDSQAALTAANLAAVEAQALEDDAIADLAASQAAQVAAASADAATQASLTTENAQLTAAQTAADAATAASNAADQALASGTDLLEGLLSDNGIVLEGDNVVLPNVATDEGLSAPFNSWFTLFGQFFDHGLDLVGKGGSGTVFIPLQKDDTLYDPGPDGIAGNADDSRTNFMVLTRATTTPGADGVFGTADDVMPQNATTSFVDQNQTYGSHASHQAFLREYELTDTGPEATGRLIEGPNGGMANWGQLKQYSSSILGLWLTDADVGMVPLLRTDAYGNFIPGANGFPQVITGVGADGIPNTADDIVVEGDPSANGGKGVSLTGAIRTTSAFLADIAHHAAPTAVADADSAVGLDNLGGSLTGVYDNELLDRHFIAGDGRVNENIGLTAVHHIFHAEHNHMADHTKEVALADAQKMLADGATQAEAVAFLNEWLRVDVTTVPTSMTGLVWDGERIFQAAKFGTEMQYQHLVFEEFARKIQPTINPFLPPDSYDVEINPSIMAEFAHVVYRFGHSMLTETVDRFGADFSSDHITLIDAFLNPVEFDADGTISDAIGAGDIIRGMTRQSGAQIDEFVTSALRDNLLGLPLDLATINLARGRDTGTPSLNAARREFYELTNNNPALRPYDSWADFAAHLKNEASIINFIAAYGTHSLITGQTTIEGKRNAALTIITGESFGGLVVPGDATDFLNATGLYAGGKLGGLEDVDLWIGGLAEQTMAFGGMLGSTFNFVFEVQMENLQNGDRFYYLQRNTGQHLFEQLEANSLASMIMRHTDATHLPGDVFSDPGLILEVIQSRQFNDLDGDGDLESEDPTSGGLISRLVIRNDPGTVGADSNYLRYTGDEHVVLGGTDDDDTLIAGIGDDTIHGDAGDDRIEGGFGNDEARGGDGDDIITDMGGDDTLKGGKGHDAINGGSGIDLILAGDGNDFAVLGNDPDGQIFGGLGNDFLLASPISLPSMGNEGDDWLEDGGNAGLFGDSLDDGFARDAIRGNDVMIGVGGGFDEYTGEGGDDIMVGSLGGAKHAGMSGFDWVTFKNVGIGMDASFLDDFIFDEAPTDPADIAIQRFESVEGLSGTRFNDRLTGGDFGSGPREDHAFLGSFLDAKGIALINGLQTLVGNGVTFFDAGDIILGGAGSDQFVGGGGDDIIDGDKWLNVRISVRENKDGTGNEIATADSMTQLTGRIFSGEINPGQLVIVREILKANAGTDIDTAIFSGVLGDYDIEGRIVNANGVVLTRARDVNGDGAITINHARGTLADGIDRLSNIEELRFTDQTLVIAGPNLPTPATVDLRASDVITTTYNFRDNFDTQSFTNSNGTSMWNTPWVETGDGGNVAGGNQIMIDSGAAPGTNQLRFTGGPNAATFDGATITRAVNLDGLGATTLSYDFGYNNIDPGETLTVQFASDGINFVTIQTILGGAANNATAALTAFTTTVSGGANAALRFTTTALNAANERFNIDNVNFTASTTAVVLVEDGTNNFTTTYTENDGPTAITSGVAIVDNDETIVLSAQIRLTNAQAFDFLSIAGTLPAGINSTVDQSVPGLITLELEGAASEAAYQTAIQAVRFSNISENPNTTPRNIVVTVVNADGPSLPAVATVTVVAVNDDPITLNDTIVTNIVGANIVVPEWALLANDSDPDGAPLDIYLAHGASGLTGLSLTTNPGSVTFADDATAGGSFVYEATDGFSPDSWNDALVSVTRLSSNAQVADNFNGTATVLSAANNSTGTTLWGTSWTEANDDANIRGGQIQIDGGAAPGTGQLRFGVGDGGSISRGVNLSGASTATLTLSFDKNNIDVGESVQVQFAADGVNFVTLNTITNTDGSLDSGNAGGALSLALTGALGANSAIRFLGTGINTVGEDVRIDNIVITYGAPSTTVTAAAGNQILVGNNFASTFTGGAGNDTVFANGGDDIINWSVGDGRDFIDGGANGAAGDRVIINGNGTVEAFVVYARADAIAAGVTGLNAATEIVITRNGIANVVAELDNVEEITINTAAGADTVTAVGNFNPTSLNFNTISVNGGGGRDTIDASLLTSAHRLVLLSGEGVAETAPLMPVGSVPNFMGVVTDGNSVAGVHSNPMFDRTLAMDGEAVAFVHDYYKLEHKALRFDAADYLII